MKKVYLAIAAISTFLGLNTSVTAKPNQQDNKTSGKDRRHAHRPPDPGHENIPLPPPGDVPAKAKGKTNSPN